MASVNQRGNFQKLIVKVALSFLACALVLVTILFILSKARGAKVLVTLSICVVLLVVSIPIAMQVVCSTALAVGSQALARLLYLSLARRKDIISRLNALEDLAAMGICAVIRLVL